MKEKHMRYVKEKTKRPHWFAFGVALIVIYKILDNLTGVSTFVYGLFKVMKPFLMAILMAYLLYIPCRKVEKLFNKTKIFKKKARGLSVFIVYVVALLLIIGFVYLIIPNLVDSVVKLATDIPSYYDMAIEYVEQMPEDSIISQETVENIIAKIKDIKIEELLTEENIRTSIETTIGVASGIFNIFVTVIISIYILLERTSILTYLRRVTKAKFSPRAYKKLDRYFIKGNTIFFKFVSSQVLDAILVGIIMAITLIIMNVKYNVLLGFMIGLFNLIPFFGAIVAVALAALITLFTGGLTQAIWVVVVLIILQQIDANIINPKIVGDALEISKILVILSVTVAGAYFGILGMFLAVPIVAVIKMIIDDDVENIERQKLEQEQEVS